MKKEKIGIIETEVPDDINHIRIDKSGEIYGYTGEPSIPKNLSHWEDPYGDFYQIGEFANGVANWDKIEIDWEDNHWVERVFREP